VPPSDHTRRRLLTLAGFGALAALAGCAGESPASDATPTTTGTATRTPVEVGGVTLPVDTSEIRQALPKDGIPAITDPAFGADWSDWSSVAAEHRPADPPTLPDDAPVIGVERDGAARAYPLRVLNWHEVVNDSFGGPLLVTYCPLCGSGVVAERTVAGEETRFGVSGRLWRDDLVLYDAATGSLWSQLLGAAIRGPETGTRLSLVPSSMTTMGEWRAAHPDTRVLLPPPGSVHVDGRTAGFDYDSRKYPYDEEAQIVGFDDTGVVDGPLHAWALVIGVVHDGVARAYAFETLQSEAVVNDAVGDLPVVVTATPGGSLAAYERTVDGETVRFVPDGDRHLRADGSRWERTTGRAVDGPHAGTRLRPATEFSPMFWKAWRDFHPDSDVYGH
jgi:hypothetical protein